MIWPLEASHDEASMRASADLTFAELIRSGATGALDMGTVHHTDVIFQSARDAGFRLTSGKAMMDHGQGMPKGLRETTRGSIDESLRLAKDWHGTSDDRLRYAFAPRFALSCSEELLREAASLDPDFALAHAALAMLGHEAGAATDVAGSLQAARRAVLTRGDECERSLVDVIGRRVDDERPRGGHEAGGRARRGDDVR